MAQFRTVYMKKQYEAYSVYKNKKRSNVKLNFPCHVLYTVYGSEKISLREKVHFHYDKHSFQFAFKQTSVFSCCVNYHNGRRRQRGMFVISAYG